jgi:hypothetical protein
MGWADHWRTVGAHPKLRSYAPGTVVGRWLIVERASNDPRGSARWRCTCIVCKAERLITGIRLRDRKGPPKRCSCGKDVPGLCADCSKPVGSNRSCALCRAVSGEEID